MCNKLLNCLLGGKKVMLITRVKVTNKKKMPEGAWDSGSRGEGSTGAEAWAMGL